MLDAGLQLLFPNGSDFHPLFRYEGRKADHIVGEYSVTALFRTSIAILTLAASAPSMAQDAAVPSAPEEKINQLIVYGNDACPESKGDEIVVCARLKESDRFRIPTSLRDDPNNLRNQAWSERVMAYEYVGASGIMSCSPSGSGGHLGCGLRDINVAYAEKAQDPGITFGRLIAAERAKRLAGIDAEAAEVEERTKEFEKGRAERETKLQAELEMREKAEQSAVDAEALPQPK